MVIESFVFVGNFYSAVGIAGLKGELVVPVVFVVFITFGSRLSGGRSGSPRDAARSRETFFVE